MKPIFPMQFGLTLCLILLVFTGYAQTPPQDGVETKKDAAGNIVSQMTYANGQLNGAFKEVSNDTVIEGSYLNNKLDGTFKRYIAGPGHSATTPNLQREAIGLYKNGVPTGNWKYFRNDKLFLQGFYLNGQRSGVWKEYGWKLTGSAQTIVFVETSFSKGKREGIQDTYYRYLKRKVPCANSTAAEPCFEYSKEPYREVKNYENNVLQGAYERIDQNGQVILSGNYVNGQKNRLWVEVKEDRIYYYDYSEGKINGYATVRDKDGHIRSKGLYKDDIKHGEWLAYFPDGKLESSEKYEAGKLVGTRTELDERGKKVATQTFKNGRLDVFTEYDANGEFRVRDYQIIEFKGERVICKVRFFGRDTVKTEIATYSIPLKAVERPNIYTNFQERFLKQTDGGKTNKHGSYEVFVEDELTVQGNYKRDKKDGVWISYQDLGPNTWEKTFRNGRFIKEVFKDGEGKPLSGKFVRHHSNGTVRSEFKVKNGVRSGKSIYWDASGKIEKEEKYSGGRLE